MCKRDLNEFWVCYSQFFLQRKKVDRENCLSLRFLIEGKSFNWIVDGNLAISCGWFFFSLRCLRSHSQSCEILQFSFRLTRHCSRLLLELADCVLKGELGRVLLSVQLFFCHVHDHTCSADLVNLHKKWNEFFISHGAEIFLIKQQWLIRLLLLASTLTLFSCRCTTDFIPHFSCTFWKIHCRSALTSWALVPISFKLITFPSHTRQNTRRKKKLLTMERRNKSRSRIKVHRKLSNSVVQLERWRFSRKSVSHYGTCNDGNFSSMILSFKNCVRFKWCNQSVRTQLRQRMLWKRKLRSLWHIFKQKGRWIKFQRCDECSVMCSFPLDVSISRISRKKNFVNVFNKRKRKKKIIAFRELVARVSWVNSECKCWYNNFARFIQIRSDNCLWLNLIGTDVKWS